MQNLSRWERSYSVGNWMLDNQHRNILTLCQQTIDRIANYRYFESVGDELIACTADHFDAEEKVLQLTGYSGFARHSEEHRHCLAALQRMLDNTLAGEISPEDFGNFLPNWCMGHILESDRHFVASIQRLP